MLTNSLQEAIELGQNNKARMIQKYIERPFVFRNENCLRLLNKKFDIRQWVLVSSFDPLRIHVFSKFYLRICSENFDLNDIKSASRHLTNYSVNKQHFIQNQQTEESVLDTDTFVEYLRAYYRIDFAQDLLPKMHSIIIDTLLSAKSGIEHRNQCFELYGFDLLLVIILTK